MTNIHPTAVIDPGARIADSAEIGPYCIVGPDVEIGENVKLLHHVSVPAHTVIGPGNVVHPFSVIGADPQDRKFRGEESVLVIGRDNMIREHVTIHRGTENGGGVTRIGDDNLVMVAAHIAHDCRVGDNTTIANQVMLAGHVVVQDGASIGGGAGIHHFATVGKYSFVGGLARINKDVPPYMIVEGNPAEVRAVNSIAMSRSGLASEQIDAMKDAFKRLYRDNGICMADKLVELRQQYASVAPVVELCDALDATADGVHGRALENMRGDDKRAAITTPSS